MARLRWTDWFWDPTLIAGLVLTALLYLWVLRRAPARRWQPAAFWTGWGTLVVALLSPLHAGAEYLFTLHMLQHMLLMIVAPPLLVLGLPPAVYGILYRSRGLRSLIGVVWSPVAATVLYTAVLLLWHIPRAYDATLQDPLVHALEHASFVAAGLVYWGVIASPSPRLHGSLGARIVMLLVANLVNFTLGFALAFAERPYYLPYTVVPRLWGLSPLDDLRLGGALMWIMGQMMYAVPLLVLLYWFLWRREERPGTAPRSARSALP